MERTTGRFCVHISDDFQTLTSNDARPRPPSLILFSLGLVRAVSLSIAAALVVTTGACSKRSSVDQPRDYSTVEMIGARNMFMGGVITPTSSSGDFLVIVELTPAKHDDATKMCDLLRAGHTVALRLREEAGEAPILVGDLTSFGVVIRCGTLEEAKRVIDRLHAWPSR